MIRPTSMMTVAGAALLATACAEQVGAPAAAARSSGRQCFLASQVNGYAAVSDNIVLVQAGANRYFRLDLQGSCPNVDWSRRVGLRTIGGSNWICRGLDAEIIVPEYGMGPQRCLVRSVSQISKDEWRAARRAR